MEFLMLNYLWAGMIFIGILYAAFTGRMPDITDAALDSSKEAVTLCITMMGVMSFWTGLMEIATRSGMIENISKKRIPCPMIGPKVLYWASPFLRAMRICAPVLNPKVTM